MPLQKCENGSEELGIFQEEFWSPIVVDDDEAVVLHVGPDQVHQQEAEHLEILLHDFLQQGSNLRPLGEVGQLVLGGLQDLVKLSQGCVENEDLLEKKNLINYQVAERP